MSTHQFRVLAFLTVVAGFLGGGVAVVLLEGIPALRITAREITLVDTRGNKRMLLGVNEHNVAGLHLYSTKGKELLTLAADKDGTPGLFIMNDSAGKQRLGMNVWSNGAPSLSLFDSAGKTGLSMNVFPNGASSLAMYDSAGKQRLDMRVHKGGVPDLALLDSAGEAIWHAP